MPRIRDLGINSIPGTQYYADGGGTIECPGGTCEDKDKDKDDHGDGGTVECPGGTCERDDKDDDAASPRDGSDGGNRGLNTLAISQLRQQLDQHLTI
ncbi:MAG TPA: hypothetical protein VNI54_10845 [Thermoanaerobaculia bacterium]|nr:hypothetical protein [Thermoanaerobaculia bacterium]